MPDEPNEPNEPPRPDATPADATPADATRPDAKLPDTTPSDATPSDATPSDATPSDTTPSDTTPSGPGEARHAAGPPRRRRGGGLGHSVLLGGRRRRGPDHTAPGPAGATGEPEQPPASDPAESASGAPAATGHPAADTEPVVADATVAATQPPSSAAGASPGGGGAAGQQPPAGSNATDRPSPSPEPRAEPPAEAQPELTGRQRLVEALRRPGRGQILIAVLLLVFGLGMVTQLREVRDDSTYANARRADLIQILDGLTNENRRLEGELGELQSTRTSLQSGANAQRVAREEASKRIEQLSILAGLIPVEGPGIRMVITDPNNAVTAQVLLDAIEELRDAGAEVIEINDSIRLVASSWFGQDARGLIVDGTVVSKPIVIEAIGDPHSLTEGANFRGGIVSEIQSAKIGGSVQIMAEDTIEITSLHAEKKNQYARPASPQPS